jgi:lipopolysaccharide transport system ATP-binding protein
MPDAIITVENLSKKYLVGHQTKQRGRSRYLALRDVIGREVRNAARKTMDVVRGRQVLQGDEVEEFWALKDVSFEVKRGEVLGVIGRNGAGKSTLLKILSRITEPTHGRISLRGRIASLLEVGTGFHPELTGRENIFLNGAILGMTRREIAQKFDEIVAFAEVEMFLDTPVKHYSSGMYVRLAFAVAAHLEPEILIVDEVLAVGDAEFQKKCLGKMEDVSRRDGRTVLFVSHNMGVVTTLCPTAIWLDRGSIRERGAAREVVSEYLERRADSEQILRLTKLLRPQWVQDDRLRLSSIEWLSDLPLRHGEPAKARIRFDTRAPVSRVSVGIGFCTGESTRLVTYYTDYQDGFRPDLSRPGEYSVDVTIDSLPLAPDVYEIEIGCRSGELHVLDHLPACSLVEVVAGPNTPGNIIIRGAGARLPTEWSWDFARQSRDVRPIEEVGTERPRGAAVT